MTMRCKNGQPHTHETVAEARTCWTPLATSAPVDTRTMAKPAPATEGMYRMDGHIYRVQFGEAGHLYARRLNLVSRKFEVARGVVAILNQGHRLTLDEAKEFGRLTGVCVRCGRDLFVPESVAAGIGPKCATLI
jgi:hypothetical protein